MILGGSSSARSARSTRRLDQGVNADSWPLLDPSVVPARKQRLTLGGMLREPESACTAAKAATAVPRAASNHWKPRGAPAPLALLAGLIARGSTTCTPAVMVCPALVSSGVGSTARLHFAPCRSAVRARLDSSLMLSGGGQSHEADCAGVLIGLVEPWPPRSLGSLGCMSMVVHMWYRHSGVCPSWRGSTEYRRSRAEGARSRVTRPEMTGWPCALALHLHISLAVEVPIGSRPTAGRCAPWAPNPIGVNIPEPVPD